MRQTLDYAQMAFRNILGNKMRSLLTMLGIIIGIASVIAVLSIGSGGQKNIQDSLSGFVTGAVYVYVGGEESTYTDYITLDDIKVINQMPEVAGATMLSYSSGMAKGTREEVSAQIESGNPSMNIVVPSSIAYGRKWNENDYYSSRRVCTIDSNGAKELFGSDNVAGMPMTLTMEGRTAEFTIIGVTKSQGSMPGRGVTVNISMPITTMHSVLGYEMDSFFQIAIMPKNPDNSYATAQLVADKLALRHNNVGRKVYDIQDTSMMMDEVNTVLATFTTIIAAIAGISLLVGGIGVMNIMLVSVTERTREIGIRKALGAKTGTITLQFLIESATLTLVGGIIGMILGIWGGYSIGSLMGITASVSISLVIGIAIFSSAIGIFFGIYPARKAAKLNPIEALRSD